MKPRNILVVEDELITGKNLTNGLISKGYKNVILVNNSKDALEYVSNYASTDVVIMDITNDNKKHYGIDTARRIINTYDIPVIFLTGDSDIKGSRFAAKDSLCGYLTKPINPQELTDKLEQAFTRHRKQKKIKLSEEKYRAIADGYTLSIFIIQDERIVYANKTFQQLTGYSASEIYNFDTMILKRLLPNEDINRNIILSELVAVKNPEQLSISMPLKIKNGQVIWVELYSKVIKYNNRPARLVTLIDITELREAESETHHKFNEVNKQKKFIDEIIHLTSQNLQNPLINILGFSAEIERDIKSVKEIVDSSISSNSLRDIINHDIPESLQFIVKNATKMQRNISSLKQILNLKETQLKKIPLQPEIIINKIIKSRQSDLINNNINIKVSPVLHTIKADKELIEITFANIIDNCIKFYDTEKNSYLEVSSVSEGEFVTYFFKDNGIGIPKRCLKTAFGIFNRFHSQDYAGDGVGLTLVKEIVGLHDGYCRIESEEGQGTIVTVKLRK
ncbi:MAG: ATP-binding protein [Fidelibacterota bacterium]